MRSISFPQDALTLLCRRHRISQLALFGSTIKGTAQPDSDVDVLATFEPDATPSYLDLSVIQDELSALLGGTRVDLRTPMELSRYFRDDILREAEVQYAAE